MEAERSTYLLWKRFSMPTKNGDRDAISLPFEDSKKLLSAYTLMVEMIVLQFWTLIVLVAISAYVRKNHSPNSGVASAAIWNSQGSAFTVLTLMARYLFHMKKRRDRQYILLWGFAAAAIIAVVYVSSILAPRFLLLGNSAPVDPNSIFVPEPNDESKGLGYAYTLFSLGVLASLRAAGSVNATTQQRVTVSDPVTSSGVNGTIKQVGYAYNITAADFGLQHAAGLILNVEGSCITEYRWLVSSVQDECNVWIDSYQVPGGENLDISLYDGRPPIGYFRLGPAESESNTTFTIAISSAGRYSFSEGMDPVYATTKNLTSKELRDQGINNTVMTRRPILSCWQNDIWSYKGHQSPTSGLSSLPGLKMSEELAKYFFRRFLGIPMIVRLGGRLGGRIQSASTTLGQTFDAGSASMEKDLQQLVTASYIASKNILADTTTVKSNLTNDVIDPKTGLLYPGIDGFIVTSGEIGTLSVKLLIIIPVILVLLFIIVTFLTNEPASWNKAQALQATILYSCLDERLAGRAKGTWNRDSNIPYLNSNAEDQRALSPDFEKVAGLFWFGRHDEE